MKDLAETAGVHIRTAQGWKREGMPVVPGSSPVLVMGSAVRAFIRAKTGQTQGLLGRRTVLLLFVQKGRYRGGCHSSG